MDSPEITAEVERIARNVFERVANEINKVAEATGSDPHTPSVIYHYGSLRTLRGMVEENELWMTPMGYLNDTREFIHGRGIALTQFNAEKQNKNSVSEFLDVYDSTADQLRAQDRNDIFVCCFATHGDQLSQWRGYAANGYGYAIGIDTALLRNWIPTRTTSKAYFITPSKVIYDAAGQDYFCRMVLACGYNATDNYLADSDLTPEAKREVQARVMRFTCNMFLPLLKDEGFREEQEARLIVNTEFAPEMKKRLIYTDRNGILVPHLVVKGKDTILPICDIRIGPNLDKDQAEWSLRHLLKNKGYDLDKIRIEKSKVPYISAP